MKWLMRAVKEGWTVINQPEAFFKQLGEAVDLNYTLFYSACALAVHLSALLLAWLIYPLKSLPIWLANGAAGFLIFLLLSPLVYSFLAPKLGGKGDYRSFFRFNAYVLTTVVFSLLISPLQALMSALGSGTPLIMTLLNLILAVFVLYKYLQIVFAGMKINHGLNTAKSFFVISTAAIINLILLFTATVLLFKYAA